MPPKRKTPEEHLAKYMQKQPAGCWLWVRPTRRDKLVWNGDKSVHARKFAYFIHFKEVIDPPYYLKPTCGNPHCIHPEHQAIVAKRYLGATKLTDEAIIEILHKVENKASYRKIAKE